MDLDEAQRLAEVLLKCARTEFPNNPNHTLLGPEDVRSPKALHPAFYGCFDWHSAVHSHWSLVRLLNRNLLPSSSRAGEVLSDHLSAKNIEAELAYFKRPGRGHFERTYGWAWLLTLAAELASGQFKDLGDHLLPLEEHIVDRFVAFLPTVKEPNRTGLHNNSAFTLALLWDYCRQADNPGLKALVQDKALEFFENDAHQPEQPGPYDFLSPTLVEADLMTRLLPADQFAFWFGRALPGFDPDQLLPVDVPDRTDPYIVHRDGLNLSRAWCLRHIAHALGAQDARYASFVVCAERHANASLPYVASGHFEGEHWLPTFAIYLLSEC